MTSTAELTSPSSADTPALATLDAEGIDAVLTYGDPAFYGRLGFRPLDPRETAPPFPLSMPQGWLGRLPGGEASGALPPLRGTSRSRTASRPRQNR